jgi:hypothetical protein
MRVLQSIKAGEPTLEIDLWDVGMSPLGPILDGSKDRTEFVDVESASITKANR